MDAQILLVVSDRNQAGIRSFLEQEGLAVTSADGLQAAQRLLSGLTYDLVLVNATLPDGSWQDLLEFLLWHFHSWCIARSKE